MKIKEIKLKSSEIKHLETFIREDKDAQRGYHMACNLCRKASDKIWIILKELYPEAMDKSTAFNSKTNIISYLDQEE